MRHNSARVHAMTRTLIARSDGNKLRNKKCMRPNTVFQNKLKLLREVEFVTLQAIKEHNTTRGPFLFFNRMPDCICYCFLANCRITKRIRNLGPWFYRIWTHGSEPTISEPPFPALLQSHNFMDITDQFTRH